MTSAELITRAMRADSNSTLSILEVCSRNLSKGRVALRARNIALAHLISKDSK